MRAERAATGDPPATDPTVRELLAEARERLRNAALDVSSREASLLLSRVLGLTETGLIARDHEPVSAAEAARFETVLARRLSGEPIAYIVGEREFFGRPFHVDRRVLIPRPETEHLVEHALDLDLSATPLILDLGTGSGCIAVTLACECSRARVVAVDRAAGALAVARRNARRHRVATRVHCVAGSWAAALDLRDIDLVVSNPPYVSATEESMLSPEILDHEPGTALFGGGRDGTGAFVALLESLRSAPCGTPLLCEIGAGRLDSIVRLATDAGWTVREIGDDYAGMARIVHLSKDRADREG